MTLPTFVRDCSPIIPDERVMQRRFLLGNKNFIFSLGGPEAHFISRFRMALHIFLREGRRMSYLRGIP